MIDEANARAEASIAYAKLRYDVDVEPLLAESIDGLANPYLEAVEQLGGPWGWSVMLDPSKWDSEMAAHIARDALVTWYAWAIPSEEALALVGAGEVVEVGAGGGYWAAMLRARGVTVHAYDREPGGNCQVRKSWTQVERGSVAAAARHPQATLLLCWPPYRSTMADRAVEGYVRAGGRRIIYIGEDGGCTGESTRLNRLEPVRELGLPQWPGIHDTIRLYEPG